MLLTLFKRKCFFPFLRQVLETEMTWSQPILVRKCISKNQDLYFLVTLKGKRGINRI